MRTPLESERARLIGDVTLLVVADDQATRESLASTLRPLGGRVEIFDCAEAMLAHYDERPGCAAIALRLPGLSGLELLEKLNARNAPLGVVIVSDDGDVREAVRAMKQGAVDFLHPPYTPEELRESLACALERGIARSQAIHLSQSLAAFEGLSESERQVLELTVDGVPNKNIASRLGISLRTVHVRRAALMRKLGVKNRFQLIRFMIAHQPPRMSGPDEK